MSDLRERLLELQDHYSTTGQLGDRNRYIFAEAVDEINRLRNIAIERMYLFKQAANNVERLDAQLASARKALEAVAAMIHDEQIEAAVVDTSTMMTLGDVVQSALTSAYRKDEE